MQKLCNTLWFDRLCKKLQCNKVFKGMFDIFLKGFGYLKRKYKKVSLPKITT